MERLYCLMLLAALAVPAAAEDLVLPVSGAVVALPEGAGAWRAEVLPAPGGDVDLLLRDAPGLPPLQVALALGPAGDDCSAALQRLARRAGQSLFPRPDWLGPRWHVQATDETDFEAGLALQAVCATAGARPLSAVIAHGGDAGDLGPVLAAVLEAVADAASADAALSFAPAGAPQAAGTSLAARLRFMADPASADAALAARSGMFTLPAGAGVLVRVEEKVTSKKAAKNAPVKASVAQDVVQDEAVLIRKGTPVKARVADVDSASLGGSGGSLQIAIDATTAVDGQAVPLAYVSEKAEGKDTRGISLTGYFTGWGLLSKGKEAEIPAGASVEARTTGAVAIRAGN